MARGMIKHHSVAGSSRRAAGAEWRAARWLVRHPGWLTAAALVGGSTVELGAGVTAGVVGAGVAGLTGWYRAHPDTFDAYAAPVIRAWRRRWLGAYRGRRWGDLMGSCGLTRTHHRTGALLVPRVLRVRAFSPSIDLVHVKLAPGQSPRAFMEQTEELAATLGAERVAVERHRPGHIVLIVQRDEPFSQIIPIRDIAEGPGDVDLSAVYLGETEHGTDWTEPLTPGTHCFNVGATGSGKTQLAYARLRGVAPLIRAGLVRPWICDPKLMEFQAVRALATEYANDAGECAELVKAFVENMQRKQRRMQREGIRSAEISRAYPLDWLIVDEIGYLLAYNTEYASTLHGLLATVASMGRVTHDLLDCYVQEPTKDVVPIRDLLTHRVCMRVTSDRHVDMALGDGMRAKGAIADEIPADPSTAGIGYRVDVRHGNPQRVRGAYTSDEKITELVNYVTRRDTGNDTGSGLRVVS
jgi:S-DNA-T family DNA segregation ATPase FtsK/SpoIIIE